MEQLVINQIIEIAKSYSFIEAVYLFGSQAKGEASVNSDIDIAALLKYEVVKENYLIYQKNDFDAASYQSLTIRKYLDFEYYLKKNQQKFKERILNG